MTIASCNLIYSFIPQLLNLQRVWLKGIALSVFWHLGDDFAGVAELAHFAGAPSVEVAFFIVMNLILLNEELVLLGNMCLVELLNHAWVDERQTRRSAWPWRCVAASWRSHRLILDANLTGALSIESALIWLLIIAGKSLPHGSLGVTCKHFVNLVIF